MRVSGERAGYLRRVMLGRGFACEGCGSVGTYIKGARWSASGPPALEVAFSKFSATLVSRNGDRNAWETVFL